MNLPKVTELDAACLANQDVLWFHVTMEDSMGMKVKKSRDKLACNPPDHTHFKVSVIFQNLEQITFSKLSYHTNLLHVHNVCQGLWGGSDEL